MYPVVNFAFIFTNNHIRHGKQKRFTNPPSSVYSFVTTFCWCFDLVFDADNWIMPVYITILISFLQNLFKVVMLICIVLVATRATWKSPLAKTISTNITPLKHLILTFLPHHEDISAGIPPLSQLYVSKSYIFIAETMLE